MRYVIWVSMIAGGCTCLPAPTTDVTPPTTSITVEYYELGGASASKSVAVGEPDVTINARKDRRITVMYAGADNEGVKKVQLQYDMHYSTGTTSVSPLLAEISQTAGCPRQAPLLDVKRFEPDGNPWQYAFNSLAINWVGTAARSGKVTVITH